MNIQQKACRSSGWLGLDRVLFHNAKYPEFNGKHQIPKDFYEKFEMLEKLSEKEAGKLCRHDWKLWHEIQKVKQAGIVIEPMKVTYSEIQRDTIYDTISRNRDDIKDTAKEQMNLAIKNHKPTVKACIEPAKFRRLIEGILTGSAKAFEKCCEGKALKEFDEKDFKEIGHATVEGSLKGAVRGPTVYISENYNYTPIPGVVAGSAVTVSFESAKAIKSCCDGKITKKECAGVIEKSVIVAAAGGIGAKLEGRYA